MIDFDSELHAEIEVLKSKVKQYLTLSNLLMSYGHAKFDDDWQPKFAEDVLIDEAADELRHLILKYEHPEFYYESPEDYL